ncbi:hypothetical protein F1C58_08395 [Glaciihabitans sp. INWT7]|uniref:hypothetical protein n=1 Tax=Glaciihabitans sp. INWT7 TaxID=2596912 RepID=UPI001626054D|nr:hypothetical protein [Glaciihabitans sp. INWT7]QNE46920.1 hypothetical protein F1C58_08395 [Glaciihabitans sp. INWT7]
MTKHRAPGPESPVEVAAMLEQADAELARVPHLGMTTEQAANLASYTRWLFGVPTTAPPTSPRSG